MPPVDGLRRPLPSPLSAALAFTLSSFFLVLVAVPFKRPMARESNPVIACISWTSAVISRLKISMIISWSVFPLLLRSSKTSAVPDSVPGEHHLVAPPSTVLLHLTNPSKNYYHQLRCYAPFGDQILSSPEAHEITSIKQGTSNCYAPHPSLSFLNSSLHLLIQQEKLC